MKNLLKLTLTVTLIYNNLFGMFAVVTDPTSYTYYAQQIKAFNDQIKTGLDQLESINKVNDAMNKANDLINNAGERIYNPTRQITNLVKNVQGIQKKFQRMANNVSQMGTERFFKDYHNVNEPLKDDILKKWKDDFTALFDHKEDEKYQKLNDKVLEAIEQKNYEKYQKAVYDLNQYLKLKGIEQRALKKYALLAPVELYNDYFMNEETVKDRQEKMERVQQLAKQIESSNDMVKQQKTTNQFLIEMLDIQQSQYEMQMKFFYAISLNLLNEKKSPDLKLDEVVDARKSYKNSDDTIKSKSTNSVENYLDNLIKSKKGTSISDIMEGKVR